ncbi:MAG: hypothetical protein FWF85_02455 [Clostridiales bacterium]|nr:hypothetical protein [Clostridiales bacterium]
MIGMVAEGISLAIRKAFGSAVGISHEELPQDLKGPYFFILPLMALEEPHPCARSLYQYSFDVHYFPLQGLHKNKDMLAVAEKLRDVLRVIQLSDGPVRGINLQYEIIDNVLHFLVTYKIFVTERM